MCRWMAWHGQPVLVDELLFKTQHGLVDQSLHSRMGAETTNGDGFGVGWYGTGDGPGIYRSVAPAWGDANLRHLAAHIESPLFMSHVRAAIGSPVQETNCHPFRHGDWLMVHNGLINDLHVLRRDLMLAVAPERFTDIQGTTDTEVLFHLALTFGLQEDPPAAVARTIGLVESVGRTHGVEHPFQGTIATTDGESVWAFRYSSEGRSRSLFFSTDVRTLRAIYPENELLQSLGDEARLVVSEPLGDELPGAWNEVPESSWGVIKPGDDEIHAFEPVGASA